MSRRALALFLLASFASALRGQEATRPSAGVDTAPDSRPKVIQYWLARHQSADGRWSSDQFPLRCAAGAAKCTGAGSPGLDVGVTSLALLGFMGLGFDERRPGPYRECIKSGLAFLLRVQDSQGRFCPPDSPHFAWSQTVATLAMAEAWQSTEIRAYESSARRGLDFITDPKTDVMPWRDSFPPSAEQVRTAAWALVLFSSAHWTDLQGPRLFPVYRQAALYVDEIADSVNAAGSESRARGLASSTVDCAIAASGLAPRLWSGGETQFELQRPDRMRALLKDRLPAWSASAQSNDFQSWFFVTRALYRDDDWPKRSESIRNVVLSHWIDSGCAYDSWDSSDAFGEVGGRVYSTAMMMLILAAAWKR